MATAVGNVSETILPMPAELGHSAFSNPLEGYDAVKLASAMRILFGSIFLFDGILKWYLFQQGTMQGVVQGFNIDYLSNNWVLVGALIGLGETAAGIALVVGLFQRPAALAAAAIMGSIWWYGGYGGWGQPGYTDPGGDLMLGLVFVALIFVPCAYGLASRWKLRERWNSSSISDRVLRFIVA
jgi:uncharacterized membrane protein YphA (DoxX/SURF4 family)